VNVVSKPGLMKLIKKHPQAKAALLAWHKQTRSGKWNSLVDVRSNFPSADLVGHVLIFNVLHNELRLITTVYFRHRRIYVKALMTHKEYDRKEWMKWA
jgi:mRNA interferase HigB